ncbi:cryptochrome/photolyase family protein [Tropicimonas marinistellae]|uniref:cryptochrome/photolyase family protein n=1 Tax=Tropicimonas marinistellae TaxID=1739787 RepID=UPI00083299F4|nr:deoxyribodipyrimidine photo-lyase [Tropicimonas marinistellae]
MQDSSPILLWLRRDLRMQDAPALAAACASGRPVVPVFIRDASVDNLGAAPKWRLGRAVEVFAASLAENGSRLILRSGNARDVLLDLVRETGAADVYWSRLYDPASVERDTAIKSDLKKAGLAVHSFATALLFEPWEVATGGGGHYKVYSPFWRAVRGRDVAAPSPAPSAIPAPDRWPLSETLDQWDLSTPMRRGAEIVGRYTEIGEAAAQRRFDAFLDDDLAQYAHDRNALDRVGTSGMSPYLATGEIGPRTLWHAAMRAHHDGNAGAETYLKELVWREFAWHLCWHTPHILHRSWREEWDAFPWNKDENHPDAIAWKRACTGVPLVDAGLREMQVTGTMHNRARMVVASYLTKHLMCDWRIGQRWFEQHLVDWDPASNAMGWQWVAGSGPDAAPYFRIFNPETQRKTFDPDGTYVARWIAEGQESPPRTALDYFEAVPARWNLRPSAPYPEPTVGLAEGRARALAAYDAARGGSGSDNPG